MSKNEEYLEELRRRAEDRLQETKRELSSTPSQAELQRLVHELEVHQIELELQNEELEHARSELESYLKKYTDLYDFAPVGYLVVDPDGLIRQVNLTGARMLGTERVRLIDQHFARLVSADSRSAVRSLLAKVFQEQVRDAIVVELQTTGSERCFVHVEATVAKGERECRLVLVDITAQRLAEQSLEASERKYRTLFETMSQGVVHQCPTGKILSANPSAERTLGLSIRQMKGRRWTDLFSEIINEDGSEFPEETHPYLVALRTGRALQDVVMGISLPGSDRHIWLSINAVPQFRCGEGNPFQVVMILDDITDRKRMAVYNSLTAREKEVFALLAKNLSRTVVAENLDISPKTVDKHRENLMAKLNIYEIEGIVKFAALIGLD